VTLFGDICCQCCISYLSTGFSTKSATKRGERKISSWLSSFERIDFVDNEPFACDVLDSAGHTVPCKLCFVRALLFYRDPCLTQWVLLEEALLLKDNEQGGIMTDYRWHQTCVFSIQIHAFSTFTLFFSVYLRFILVSLVLAATAVFHHLTRESMTASRRCCEERVIQEFLTSSFAMYSTRSTHKNINPNCPRSHTFIGQFLFIN